MKTTLLDFPGHVACTIFTGGCNFRCPFCHNAELLDMNLPAVYSEEEIFAFLEKRKHTLEGVAITGGEPTLQKDLKQFIRNIRERFGLRIKLDTNGFRPSVLRELLDEELLDYAAVDIKSGPSGYGKAVGIADIDLAPIRESIEILRRGAIPYEFRTTVVKGLHETRDFEEIGQLIEGCSNYYIQSYRDDGNVLNREAGFGAFTKAELLAFLEIVRSHVGHAELRGVEY